VNNPIPVTITKRIEKLTINHTVNCHKKASVANAVRLQLLGGET